jgi:hypothetical protein
MRALREVVSPMALAGLVIWLVVMVVVTNLAISVFANVGGGPQPFCPQATCAPQPTTEWLPSLATAFVAATLVVGGLWGAVTVVRRRG